MFRRGTKIKVSTVIDTHPKAVWASVEDISTHPEWMADAVALRFTTDAHAGIGAAFEVDTKVGPFRLTDHMEVTVWEPREAMGIRHVGVVTGEGVFRLKKLRRGRTRFVWSETLYFPWWMGGRIGGVVGGRMLTHIWKGNLRRLKARIET